MKDSTRLAVESYINGNRQDFKKWLKRASKLEFLYCLRYFTTHCKKEDIPPFLRSVEEHLGG
jgi:hypothetical protein